MTKQEIEQKLNATYTKVGTYPNAFSVSYANYPKHEVDSFLVTENSTIIDAKESYEYGKKMFIKNAIDAVYDDMPTVSVLAYAERDNDDVIRVKNYLIVSNL